MLEFDYMIGPNEVIPARGNFDSLAKKADANDTSRTYFRNDH